MEQIGKVSGLPIIQCSYLTDISIQTINYFLPERQVFNAVNSSSRRISNLIVTTHTSTQNPTKTITFCFEVKTENTYA